MKSIYYYPVVFLALFLMISFGSCKQKAEDQQDQEIVEDDPEDMPCLPPIESAIPYDVAEVWEHNMDSLISSSPEQFGIWPDYFQIDMSLFNSQIDTQLHSHFRLYYGLICNNQTPAVVLLSTSLPIDCNSILHSAQDSVIVLLPFGTEITACGITEPTIKISFDTAISWTNRWRTFNNISDELGGDLRDVNETKYKTPLAFNFNYKQFCSVIDTNQSVLAIKPGLMKVDTVDYNFYEYKLILDDNLNAPVDADYLDFASPCPRHCGNYSDPLLSGGQN